MRKVAAILFLSAFFALQYARQAGYFECKLSNYFSSGSEQCDCEKLLSEKDTSTAPLAEQPVHKHIHPDESYCFSPATAENSAVVFNTVLYNIPPGSYLPDGVKNSADRPPGLS